MNQTCPLCNALSLNIEGVDIEIKPYIFRPNKGLRLGELSGESVHSFCLKSSVYAQEFSSGMSSYAKDVLGSREGELFSDGFIAKLPNTGDLIILFDSTFCIWMEQWQMHSARTDSTGVIVPHKDKIWFNALLSDSEKQDLEGDFRRDGIPLSKVLRLAGVSQDVCQHIRLENSRLVAYEGDPEESINALGDNLVSGNLTHEILLPKKLEKMIFQ